VNAGGSTIIGREHPVQTALSNSFAFGGNNACILGGKVSLSRLGGPQTPPRSPEITQSPVVWFSLQIVAWVLILSERLRSRHLAE
jgi:hypothetical protein